MEDILTVTQFDEWKNAWVFWYLPNYVCSWHGLHLCFRSHYEHVSLLVAYCSYNQLLIPCLMNLKMVSNPGERILCGALRTSCCMLELVGKRVSSWSLDPCLMPIGMKGKLWYAWTVEPNAWAKSRAEAQYKPCVGLSFEEKHSIVST